ncbi:MAG: CBS domain-containing protein [Rhodospirillaceae bacterium]
MYVAEVLRAKGAEVITIVQTETIETAAKVLGGKKFGSLTVRDRSGKLAGIITERDIIRAVADKGAAGLTYKVEDFMTREVRTCKTTASIKDVMELMALRRIRHVPVVENGELLGMISSNDVVKYRLEERSAEVAVLRDVTKLR